MPNENDKIRFWETFNVLRNEIHSMAFKVDLMWKAFLGFAGLVGLSFVSGVIALIYKGAV